MATEQKVSKRVEKELHQTRVVLRHLPPDINQDSLLEKFSPVPPEGFYFFPGDPDLGPQGCARAYINFTDEAAILSFRDQFDGMVLESQKGHQYRVLVEYAPYHGGIRKTRKKADVRCGTIEEDADYQAFLKGREQKAAGMPALDFEAYMDELKASKVSDVQVTPLIAYLRNKKGGSKSSKKKQVFVVERKKKKGKKEKEGKEEGGSRRDKRTDEREGGRKKKRDEEKASKRVDSELRSGGGLESDKDHVGFEKSSHGSEKWGGGSPHEVRQNGDVGLRKEKERSGTQRRPDRAIYTPRSRDHRERSDAKSSQKTWPSTS
jgi:regulator of nonsense transcripts 3